MIVLGIGGFLFALPKLFIPPYEPVGGSQSIFDSCKINKSIPRISCEKKYSNLHVAILFIAQFIMGGGTTPLYTLGK